MEEYGSVLQEAFIGSNLVVQDCSHLGSRMTSHECYRFERQFEEATKTLLAAENDLDSTSPNASPRLVREARLQTVRREQAVAREILIEHRRSCSVCKAKGIPD
jgi:hypothetical protein